MGVGLSPNLLDLLKNGQKNLQYNCLNTSDNNGKIEVKNSQGGTATLAFLGATLSASHRNFPQTHAIYVTGSKEFSLRLTLQS